MLDSINLSKTTAQLSPIIETNPEILSPAPTIAINTEKTTIYKVAALGLAILLTGIWVGRLAYSNNNEFMLWDKGLQNPDIVKLQNENKNLTNQIQSLKAENSLFEQKQIHTLEDATVLNKELTLKLDELKDMELNNKNLTQYSNELNKSITEEDKKLKTLEADSLIVQTNQIKLKEKFNEAQKSLTSCTESLRDLRDKEIKCKVLDDDTDYQLKFYLAIASIPIISMLLLMKDMAKMAYLVKQHKFSTQKVT